jgi:hypothetical protein
MTPEAGVKINSARFVPSSFTMSKFTYVKLRHKGRVGRGRRDRGFYLSAAYAVFNVMEHDLLAV